MALNTRKGYNITKTTRVKIKPFTTEQLVKIIKGKIEKTEGIEKIEKDYDGIISKLNTWTREYKDHVKKFLEVRNSNEEYMRTLQKFKDLRRTKDGTERTDAQIFSIMVNRSENGLKELKLLQRKRNYDKASKLVLKDLLDGYYLWEKLRLFFTGQSIVFNIAYHAGKNAKWGEGVYEASKIKVEDLLSRGTFSLQYSAKGRNNFVIAIDALKYDSHDNSLNTQKIQSLMNQEKNNNNNSIPRDIFYQQLLFEYDGIKEDGKRFIKDIKNHKYPAWVTYEVYIHFQNDEDFPDFPLSKGVSNAWFDRQKYKNTAKWLDKLYSDVYNDKTSGRVIGDYLNIQAKDISRNSAHLSAIATLSRDIDIFLDTIKMEDKNKRKEKLKDLFTLNSNPEKLDTLTKNINESAQDYLENMIEILF